MCNRPTPFSLPIPPGDIPLIAEALNVQICTEMMCGRPKAVARLESLRAALDPAVPTVAKAFDAGDWSVVCAVIAAGGRPEIAIEPPSWRRWSSEGAISIRLGGATWRSSRTDFKPDDPLIGEIRAYLDSLAPMPD